MTSREKIYSILSRTNTGKPGYWTGNPHADTFPIYFRELGVSNAEELYTKLGDDLRWFPADGSYRKEGSNGYFGSLKKQNLTTLSEGGVFEGDVTLADIEKADWPDVKYLNFDRTIARIRQFPDKAVFTGFWSCFYHDIMGFFGMEDYFVKMISEPEIVEAVTEHVIDFLCAANDLFFTALGDDADTFFFGNDFGTQLSTMISPALFKKFVLPGSKRLIDVAKKHGKKVVLHSCGCIYDFIPLLIDAGIDGLHPLQAKAVNMDAATLSREFKNDLAFMGGIDTQELLMYATPEEIKEDVRRVRRLLGPNLIVSPSHEALLPNVPLANVIAMSEAAKED